MKKIEHIHQSWCVKHDGSQLFKDTVVKYLNDNYRKYYNGFSLREYYGVNKQKESLCSSDISEYSKELTLEEFIKLTKKEMKYFKLGQTVYHPVYGEGKVIEINKSNYPVGVDFEEKYATFTFDGRMAKTESISLSQTPIPEIVNKPLEDTYIPFTFEDDLLGMKVIDKDKKFKCIICYQEEESVWSGTLKITYEDLLNNYEFLGGKVCGKLGN